MDVTQGTSSTGRTAGHSSYERVQLDWTTDASGVASDTVGLAGQVMEAVTVADESDAASYSIRLRDPDIPSMDYLATSLVQSCHSDVVEYHELLLSSVTPPVVAGDVVFHVSDAGNGQSGTCVLFLKN
jgi:hypothetical protein